MALFGKRKSFDELMDEFYDERKPAKKIRILKKAASLARTPEEEIKVVVNINQLKQDGWIKD